MKWGTRCVRGRKSEGRRVEGGGVFSPSCAGASHICSFFAFLRSIELNDICHFG